MIFQSKQLPTVWVDEAKKRMEFCLDPGLLFTVHYSLWNCWLRALYVVFELTNCNINAIFLIETWAFVFQFFPCHTCRLQNSFVANYSMQRPTGNVLILNVTRGIPCLFYVIINFGILIVSFVYIVWWIKMSLISLKVWVHCIA